MDNLKLNGIAKKYWDYLHECQDKQKRVIDYNISLLNKMVMLRNIGYCGMLLGTALFLIDIICICIFEIDWGYFDNILLISFVSFVCGFFIDLGKFVIKTRLKKSFEMELTVDELSFLNESLKKAEEEIGAYLILELNDKRYICEDEHMVDVTSITEPGEKELIKIKYYQVSFEEEEYFFKPLKRIMSEKKSICKMVCNKILFCEEYTYCSVNCKGE